MRIGNGLYLAGCFTGLLVTGCFESGPSGASGSSSAGRIHLVPSINGAKHGAAKVAPSGSSGLESFQVAVSHILLAKDLKTNGSGWSGLTGPLSLFAQDLGDFNAIDSNTARDPAWRPHYIDFCDPSSIGRIASSNPFTIRDTGEYNWAVINWSPFFKIRSTIPLAGGDTLYTHDGFVSSHLFPGSTNPGNFYYVTEASKSLLQGPSEEALVRKNNGGTWFRFLKPLRLTEADLDSTTLIADTVGRDSAGQPIIHFLPSGKWNVLLVFNAQDFLYAGKDDSSNMSINGDIQSPDGSSYIHAPFLKATAVPYRDGEDVMRETYEFSVHIDKAWAKGDYGMRLELYLIGDNVVAVTVDSHPTDGNLAPPEVPVIFFAEAGPDGTLSLQAYDRKPVFDAFARKKAVGEEGSVQWDPSGMAQDPETLGYRLTEIKKMN